MPLWSSNKQTMPRSGDSILYKGERKVLWRPGPSHAFEVTNTLTPSHATKNAVAQLTWTAIVGQYMYDFDQHIWREKTNSDKPSSWGCG